MNWIKWNNIPPYFLYRDIWTFIFLSDPSTFISLKWNSGKIQNHSISIYPIYLFYLFHPVLFPLFSVLYRDIWTFIFLSGPSTFISLKWNSGKIQNHSFSIYPIYLFYLFHPVLFPLFSSEGWRGGCDEGLCDVTSHPLQMKYSVNGGKGSDEYDDMRRLW